MGQINITYTTEQMKAMEAVLLDPQQWLQDAWDNKANNCIDKIVEQSGKGSQYTDEDTKKKLINEINPPKRVKQPNE